MTDQLIDRLCKQYDCLRGEIMYFMAANERRVFGALGVVVTAMGILVSALAAKIEVPGVAFILPLLIMIHALNIHIIYSRRVANIGSFISHHVSSVLPELPNWEKEVGEFAINTDINMSSRVSVILVYSVVVLLGCFGGVFAPLWRAQEAQFLALWHKIGSFILATLVLHWLYITAKEYRNYEKTRIQFDKYWSDRFAHLDVKPNGG